MSTKKTYKILLKTSCLLFCQGNDEAYILSKLSDDELLKLLSEQSNKNVNIASDVVSINENPNDKLTRGRKEQVDYVTINNLKKNDALFRLENEALNPNLQNNEEYKAWKKLNDLLSNLPKPLEDNEELSLEQQEKEILFDQLVSQIKSLWFKNKSKKQKNAALKQYVKTNQRKNEEYLFLILSEDIEENSDGVVSLNPIILENNASVVVLGPITKTQSSDQLNNIMNRITTELSKPEYLSILEQLSHGIVKGNAIRDIFVLSTQSRRYMKPHRCNHRSQLARVYGGPKWLLCTGYLNLNRPSLYD